VVGDVQYSNAGWGDSEPLWASPVVYLPVAQTEAGFLRLIHTWFPPSWVLKVDGLTPGFGVAVRQAIRSVNRDLPVARIASLEEIIAGALARPRFEAVFMALVAAFALILAGVGLYGIVANAVGERTTEMGVRMALGATPGSAVLTVGTAGLKLSLLGLVGGGVISVLAAPSISSIIFGVQTWDPVTLAVVILCLGGVAVLASFVPALRVGRLQPAAILREK
jgi:ABC-type antimicrobial peptide transport system permease subunit